MASALRTTARVRGPHETALASRPRTVGPAPRRHPQENGTRHTEGDSATVTVRILAPDSTAERDAGAFARALASAPREDRSAPPLPRTGPHEGERARAGTASSAALTAAPVTDAFARLLHAAGPGEPLDADIRDRISLATGRSLDAVRVHANAATAQAAAELGTRAFTVGDGIHLASPADSRDLELIAHEVAHVLQLRDSGSMEVIAAFSITDSILEQSSQVLRAVPAYAVLTVILGADPLTGKAADLSADEYVAKLLKLAGFEAAAEVVTRLALVATVTATLRNQLVRNRITLRRVVDDLQKILTDPLSAGETVRALMDAGLNALKAAGGEIVDHIRKVLGPHIEKVVLDDPRSAALWRLSTGVFHYDPLRGEPVERPTEQLLAAFFTVIGKPEAMERLRERGVLDSTVLWLETRLIDLTAIGNDLKKLVARLFDAVRMDRLPELPKALGTVADDAVGILTRLGVFAGTVGVEVLKLVKNALREMASDYAARKPGYDVIRVMLGKDPFTDREVPHGTADLLRALVKLFADDATYSALDESGRLDEAAANIDAARSRLGITWELIGQTIDGVWQRISWESLKTPLDTFQTIVDRFGDPIARIVAFTLVVAREIVSVIVAAMGFPQDVPPRIVRNVESATADIKRDPVAFLTNIGAALADGANGFADNAGKHLLGGLERWLLRGVESLGIRVPEKITVQSAITLILEVLGLNLEMLWTKLGAKLGESRVNAIRNAIDTAGEAFGFLLEVRDGGIGVLWDKAAGRLDGIWQLLFDRAMDWLIQQLVTKALPKLLAKLGLPGIGPAIAGVEFAIATLQTLVDYATDMVRLLDKIVGTVADIARGDLRPAASGVERALADAVPFAIGFLASLLGVGDLPERIKALIEGLRETVDQAVDALLDGAIKLAQPFLDAIGGNGEDLGDEGAESVDTEETEVGTAHPVVVNVALPIAEDPHHIRNDGPGGQLVMHSKAPTELDHLAAIAALVKIAQDDLTKRINGQGKTGEGFAGASESSAAAKKPSASSAGASGTAKAKNAGSSPGAPKPKAKAKKGAAAPQAPSNENAKTKPKAKAKGQKSVESPSKAAPKADAGTGVETITKPSELDEALAKLVAILTDMGQQGAFFHPGRGAPVIGHRAKHGEQPPRIRATDRSVTHLLSTESEHVLPFKVGADLWHTLLGVAPPTRGSKADKHQTTIVIYRDAALLKTDGASSYKFGHLEKAAQDLFKTRMNNKGRSDRQAIADAAKKKAGAGTSKLVDAAREDLKLPVSQAIAGTILAVKDEHGLKEKIGSQVSDKTNGDRRAEAKLTPDGKEIVKAARDQEKDLITLLEDAYKNE